MRARVSVIDSVHLFGTFTQSKFVAAVKMLPALASRV